MGESGGTSCFNDDAVIGLRNLVTERDKTKTTSVWFQIGVPKVNPERPSNGMEGAASA